jgi:hypothetical protein
LSAVVRDFYGWRAAVHRQNESATGDATELNRDYCLEVLSWIKWKQTPLQRAKQG